MSTKRKGPIVCKICRKIFVPNHYGRKYCPDCSKEAWRYRKERSLKKAEKAAQEAKKSVNCTNSTMRICKYGGTCGGLPCCNYILITGHMRVSPSRSCDKYSKGRKLPTVF